MKSILILGATSDMAEAVARVYASKGYSILLAGRSAEKLDVLKNDIAIRYNTKVEFFLFDADQSYEQHQSFYRSLNQTPDVVLLAFGYLGEQVHAQQNWKESHAIIQSNYVGAVSILNIIANDMEIKKAGVIAGISSVAGERGRQSNYIYGSAKAGFTVYLSGLRNRLFKSQVHVVTIKPGFVNTKMTEGLPLPKPLTAQPEQVAKSIYNAIEKRKNIL